MSSIFPSPWWEPYSRSSSKHLPRCKYEWEIVEISKSIREKPGWQQKYKNPVITEKWRKELKEQYSGGMKKRVDAMLDYGLRELQWYEKLAESPGFSENGFEIGCDDQICFSDVVVPEATRDLLVGQTDRLYNLFEELDYHPGSNGQVVDLVHPSLYPLQYGKTRLSTGEVVAFSEDIVAVKKDVAGWGVSEKFQWLPSAVELQGLTFKFKSYINNLDPQEYKDLYQTIEQVFNLAIPGLNYTLGRFASPEHLRVPYPVDGYYDPAYYEKREELEEELELFYADMKELELLRERYVKHIDIEYKQDPETVTFDLKLFKNVKVIVKLANIELTQEDPVYKGGSWHLEGCINEDIVTTILYYYDIENITESKLSFQCSFEDPPYEQDDSFYCKDLFGLEDSLEMVHYLGSVTARQNRLLVFPNGYMHHVDAFSLADRTKKGHRKILFMFLVDPYNEIVKTTAEVPPQQPEGSKTLTDEAKKIRQDLMEERASTMDLEDTPYGRPFTLCEH